MRYALIIAGGSGTRLWPMSRAALPKQLIPLVGGPVCWKSPWNAWRGWCRRSGATSPPESARGRHPASAAPSARSSSSANLRARHAQCGRARRRRAGSTRSAGHDRRLHGRSRHRAGEPVPGDRQLGVRPGRATSRGVGHFRDRPDEPGDRLRYLELGEPLGEKGDSPRRRKGDSPRPTFDRCPPERPEGCFAQMETVPFLARRLRQFREKPDPETARAYFEAGPEKYLWNSGMFVWRADTLLDCIRRYAPQNHAGLTRIAEAWDGPKQQAVLNEVFPTLQEDQRRLRGDGAGLARSGGGRGGDSHAACVAATWARGRPSPKPAPATSRETRWRPGGHC